MLTHTASDQVTTHLRGLSKLLNTHHSMVPTPKTMDLKVNKRKQTHNTCAMNTQHVGCVPAKTTKTYPSSCTGSDNSIYMF